MMMIDDVFNFYDQCFFMPLSEKNKATRKKLASSFLGDGAGSITALALVRVLLSYEADMVQVELAFLVPLVLGGDWVSDVFSLLV